MTGTELNLFVGALATREGVRRPNKSAMGDKTMLQKGQAPKVSWRSQKASRISGVSGSGDQGRDEQEGLSHLCTPKQGGDREVSGTVGIQGAFGVRVYSSETKSNPELRQGRRRQSMKVRTQSTKLRTHCGEESRGLSLGLARTGCWMQGEKPSKVTGEGLDGVRETGEDDVPKEGGRRFRKVGAVTRGL